MVSCCTLQHMDPNGRASVSWSNLCHLLLINPVQPYPTVNKLYIPQTSTDDVYQPLSKLSIWKSGLRQQGFSTEANLIIVYECRSRLKSQILWQDSIFSLATTELYTVILSKTSARKQTNKQKILKQFQESAQLSGRKLSQFLLCLSSSISDHIMIWHDFLWVRVS